MFVSTGSDVILGNPRNFPSKLRINSQNSEYTLQFICWEQINSFNQSGAFVALATLIINSIDSTSVAEVTKKPLLAILTGYAY